MGYSKEQIVAAFTDVSGRHPNKDVSSLWPAVLCHLREEQVYGSQPESQIRENNPQILRTNTVVNGISFPCFTALLNVTDENFISINHLLILK